MAAPARPLFVLFGSSIVQLSFSHGGWGSHLSDIYSRKVLLINSSLSQSLILCYCLQLSPTIVISSIVGADQYNFNIIISCILQWHVNVISSTNSTPLFSFFHFSHKGFHSLAHLQGMLTNSSILKASLVFHFFVPIHITRTLKNYSLLLPIWD